MKIKNKTKILCLILAFLIAAVLSSELVLSDPILDGYCARYCGERGKTSGTHEFCYASIGIGSGHILKCDCNQGKGLSFTQCDETCLDYPESRYCFNCKKMCTWRIGECKENEKDGVIKATFESKYNDCETASSSDYKCEDKDGTPMCIPVFSKFWRKSLLRCKGLEDAYWKKCEVPKSMGDCGTGDTSTLCDENGCSVSTAASAKLTVPENALPKQEDIVEDSRTVVNLGIIISVGKDYSFYDYNELESSRIIAVYNFYPNNLIFGKPSALSMDYINEMADGMIEDENNLDIYYYANGLWISLNAVHNKENKTLTSFINKLGAYAMIELIDTTPPNIILNAAPSVLWPPNNKLVDVSISGSITDDFSGVDKDSISLMVDGIQKDINLDSNGNFNITVPLLASRAGTEKQGRKYYIDLTASDNAGNIDVNSAVVAVPHDRGNR